MAEQAGVGDIVKSISEDVKTLVRGEIELAKAELVPSAKNAGIGAGMFGAAGYFALNGISLLFIAGGLALGMLFKAPTGGVALGFVVMGVLVLIIAGILALLGKGKISKVKGPERTVTEAKQTVETVNQAVTRANAQVKTKELERKHFEKSDQLERREEVRETGLTPANRGVADTSVTPARGEGATRTDALR